MSTARKGADEMYCTACGEIIPRTSKFCPECGTADPANGGTQSSAPPATDEKGLIDTIAPAASWIGVILMFLLAVGTITESVSGMPVRMAVSTVIYVLLGLFAAPPVRRWLEATADVAFERAIVVVIIVVGTIVNEGLIAPPLA